MILSLTYRNTDKPHHNTVHSGFSLIVMTGAYPGAALCLGFRSTVVVQMTKL